MPLSLRSPIPSLEDADDWLGGGPVSADQLAGHPVLIHFWALGCQACGEQLPTVKRWEEELAPMGLKVIGVHTPMIVHGNTRGEIEEAARASGLRHPIALDDHGFLAQTFDVRITPSYFIFDATGALRHYHAGAMAEEPVERMLRHFVEGHEDQPSA